MQDAKKMQLIGEIEECASRRQPKTVKSVMCGAILLGWVNSWLQSFWFTVRFEIYAWLKFVSEKMRCRVSSTLWPVKICENFWRATLQLYVSDISVIDKFEHLSTDVIDISTAWNTLRPSKHRNNYFWEYRHGNAAEKTLRATYNTKVYGAPDVLAHSNLG